jgi:hypothetical protein
MGFSFAIAENASKAHIEKAKRTVPWNKGPLVGQKAMLKLRVGRTNPASTFGKGAGPALYQPLAIDSKLRGWDLVNLRSLRSW